MDIPEGLVGTIVLLVAGALIAMIPQAVSDFRKHKFERKNWLRERRYDAHAEYLAVLDSWSDAQSRGDSGELDVLLPKLQAAAAKVELLAKGRTASASRTLRLAVMEWSSIPEPDLALPEQAEGVAAMTGEAREIYVEAVREELGVPRDPDPNAGTC